jgi:hypothetical protein
LRALFAANWSRSCSMTKEDRSLRDAGLPQQVGVELVKALMGKALMGKAITEPDGYSQGRLSLGCPGHVGVVLEGASRRCPTPGDCSASVLAGVEHGLGTRKTGCDRRD